MSHLTSETPEELPAHQRRAGWTRVLRFAACALLATLVIGAAGARTSTEIGTGTPTVAADAVELQAGAAELLAVPSPIKLRRLHLVRPDLIPYPIQLEVYC